MNDYTVYLSTGEIARSGRSTVPVGGYIGVGQQVVAVRSDPNTQFVDVSQTPHVVKNRPVFPITIGSYQIVADGVDESAIAGIPVGTKIIQIDGDSFEITDGVFEFSVDLPGSYTFLLFSPFYLTEEVTIEAVAPA